MSSDHQVVITPIIQYPQKAQIGQTYLMTIDLQMAMDYRVWPYDDEEYPVWFILDTMPLFSHRFLGEPSVVLHRFGGTYGPAQFLLTAAHTPKRMHGKIHIMLVNQWGTALMDIPLQCELQTDAVDVPKYRLHQKSNSSNSFPLSILEKFIERYYKELVSYDGKADSELASRAAFQNLLSDAARLVNWTLYLEHAIEMNLRPDGVLRDSFHLLRGIWEGIRPDTDFEKVIRKKIASGYPLTNTVFENTKRAVLYQNKRRIPIEFNLVSPNDLRNLLHQFLTYTESNIENFTTAVAEFTERIPDLARALLAIIEREHQLNKKFSVAFENFATLCRTAIDPEMSAFAMNEMLVQHLLVERLFRTIAGTPDFLLRNSIAQEIENVIQALTSRSFNRHAFLKSLDRFYVVIEESGRDIESWSERLYFLSTIYERFFQSFSVKQADSYGIVHTPQEIVDFMCASLEEVLRREFATSVAEPGVQILDPATGTGSFIVNLLRRIPRHRLSYKYQHDLFCNEIMLLPYYIASLNIEHEYYERMGEYLPFEGICFTDTLDLAESHQLPLFVEENNGRIMREKEAQIIVVIGNPPYSVMSQHTNNKNRKYAKIDERVRETYGRDLNTVPKIQLYDAYVRFFRWATDRLQDRDGVICFVSTNSFIHQASFREMRKHLLQDFTQIYHLDLQGDTHKNSEFSSGLYNVFGARVGVGITIAVRSSRHSERALYYFRVPEARTASEKLTFLAQSRDISGIVWQQLRPDEKATWMIDSSHRELVGMIPLGTKERSILQNEDVTAIFSLYGAGVRTGRDIWTYAFSIQGLESKMKVFIETYNSEVDRWRRWKSDKNAVNDFVTHNDAQIQWNDNLRSYLTKEEYLSYIPQCIRKSLYRPFAKRYLYFAPLLDNSLSLQPRFFPTLSSEAENVVICLPSAGSRKQFGCLATNVIANVSVVFGRVQCFPYYIYDKDGHNRRENISNWALNQFREHYKRMVSKWDIFHYVYGLLHHPHYSEHYTESLQYALPQISLMNGYESFATCVSIGKQLMDLHLNYEQVEEYPLSWVENGNVPFSWRVEKMRLTPNKTALVVNESLTLDNIPPECFHYRLGSRSALEWIIDQYQVSIDKRSGIINDPNQLENEEVIVRLIGKVVTVSVTTLHLLDELQRTVTINDWTQKNVDTISKGE